MKDVQTTEPARQKAAVLEKEARRPRGLSETVTQVTHVARI